MNIPAELTEWRKSLRAELIRRRLAAPIAERLRWSRAISRSLKDGFPTLRHMTVGFCWPYKGEFDGRPFVRFLRKCGARIALPQVVRKNTPLQFFEWAPGAPMTRDAFGFP